MSNKSDVLTFGQYLVAFVDLQGQSEKLKKLDRLPSAESGLNYEDFIRLAKETIGAVTDLQRSVEDFFAEKEREQFFGPYQNVFNSTKVKFQNFSDAILIYVPLKETENISPVFGVYRLLLAVGMLCVLGLAKKRPVRIGLSIGVAVELRDCELYGKAVADAYELESCVAQYPRAVVDNHVLDYLLAFTNTKCDTGDLQCVIAGNIANSAIELLANDFDGRLIIHYLGESFSDYFEEKDKHVFDAANEYVKQQLKEHQESKNTKLAMRYSLLHGYFSVHMNSIQSKSKAQ